MARKCLPVPRLRCFRNFGPASQSSCTSRRSPGRPPCFRGPLRPGGAGSAAVLPWWLLGFSVSRGGPLFRALMGSRRAVVLAARPPAPRSWLPPGPTRRRAVPPFCPWPGRSPARPFPFSSFRCPALPPGPGASPPVRPSFWSGAGGFRRGPRRGGRGSLPFCWSRCVSRFGFFFAGAPAIALRFAV